MIVRQARFEARLTLRNGEQVLLTLVIPVILLVVLTNSSLLDQPASGGSRIDVVLPSVLALAVVATSFTSLAISTGFERRYRALRRMAVTPLPRSGLLAGKAGAVLLVLAIQVLLLLGIGLALGWEPAGRPAAALLVALLGSAAFSSLGLLLAGTVRAEATLAGANVVFVLLLVLGGLVVPLSQYPDAVQPIIALLPSAALAEGLRDAFAGQSVIGHLAVLVVWTVAAATAAARYFRWE